VFLVEGETDTMRLWQAIRNADPDTDVGVVGLSGIETWQPEYADKFGNAERVWLILDNDGDYNVQGRVDTVARQIRFTIGPKVRRVRLPSGVKDVCEFFRQYDLEALRLIVERPGARGASRFKLLDLTQEPPPVQWLVEDLVCRGDIHLLLGEPGIGKSWLTMSLTLAVASGADEWLNHKLHEGGKVLYLDEENPEDLVFDRFRKLGMTAQDAGNIRYINNEGIRLDRLADELLDEALEFEPTLIVLDSLTRFHTEDENSAGAMSKLFNDALKPLARKTNAAVVLIHHANKTDSNSSYKRSRGSGDITASVDAGLDVREIGVSTLALSMFKSRRRRRDEHPINVQILDTPEGQVRLLGGVPLEVPF
jgi:KaiC/GvpD/RAD55 family RecA-like ATPase